MPKWKAFEIGVAAAIGGCGPWSSDNVAEDHEGSSESGDVSGESDAGDGPNDDAEGSGGGSEGNSDEDDGGTGMDDGSNDGCFMKGTPIDPRCFVDIEISTDMGFVFVPDKGSCVQTGGGDTQQSAPFGTQIECMTRCVIEPQLPASRAAWECLIKKHDESYAYVIPDYSSDTTIETTIVVDRGKVVERSYHEDDGIDPVTWTETGTELGTHAQGAPPFLLDALYDWCADIGEHTSIYDQIAFSVFESGALKECFSYPDCDEWCASGVYIKDLWFTR